MYSRLFDCRNENFSSSYFICRWTVCKLYAWASLIVSCVKNWFTPSRLVTLNQANLSLWIACAVFQYFAKTLSKPERNKRHVWRIVGVIYKPKDTQMVVTWTVKKRTKYFSAFDLSFLWCNFVKPPQCACFNY